MNEALMKKMMGQIDPAENPMFSGLAHILATIESEQGEELKEALKQTELDIAIETDKKGREEEIIEVIEALISGDLARYYFEEKVGIENFEQIQPFLGLSEEAWKQQKRDWYSEYYAGGSLKKPPEEATDEKITKVAQTHIKHTQELDYRTFVNDVVNWDRGRAVETLMAGPIQSYTATIRELGKSLERKNERIAELEEQLPET